jgi:hypothetical protein
MAFRVVWGTGETMDTFCPTTVLIKVDFPTEGRPMITVTAVFRAFTQEVYHKH